ncbi:TPA: hypothetical protein ACH3X1_011399 [Trebouxia sp. C0004]
MLFFGPGGVKQALILVFAVAAIVSVRGDMRQSIASEVPVKGSCIEQRHGQTLGPVALKLEDEVLVKVRD